MAGDWPRSFFCVFMEVAFGLVHKHAKSKCPLGCIASGTLIMNQLTYMFLNHITPIVIIYLLIYLLFIYLFICSVCLLLFIIVLGKQFKLYEIVLLFSSCSSLPPASVCHTIFEWGF